MTSILQKVQRENKTLFIMGDFNINLYNYSSHTETNDFIKVGDKSLIIHKSAYHLFSLLISKRGFPSLQTRKTFGKIMSGNYRFLIPVIRVMAHNCEFLLH